MNKIEDIIKHHGVLGMKWGVRKDRKGVKTSSSQNDNKKTTVNKTVKSIAREVGWRKKSKLKNMDKMSTKEIREATNRVRLENDLNKLSRRLDLVTAKDRKNYLNRSKMSNQELSRKVNRLRAKKEFKKQAREATSAHKELGKAVVAIAAPMAVGYVAAKSPDIAKKIKSIVTEENLKTASRALKFILR